MALTAVGHLLLPGQLVWLIAPAFLLGAAFGWLVVSFNQIMYREIGSGGNVTYAMLTALLLGARMLLMVAASRTGCELQAGGTDYAGPVFSAATLLAAAALLAALGAAALICAPIAKRSPAAHGA